MISALREGTMLTIGQANVAIDGRAGTFRVSREAFTSDAVFAAERSGVFDRCWLYIGHEAELPEPGRFVARRIAGRELIFNRDTAGTINAFFDSCPHRGAKICAEKVGVARQFHCIYHGWNFGSDGKLKRQPHHSGYPEDFNHDGSLDLVRVPRLESYRGFWFVNFDPDAIGLGEYLGDARDYIDCFADQSDRIEIVSGAQEYGIAANWKLLCENSIDGYHANNLHATYFDFARNVAPPSPQGVTPARLGLEGVGRALGNGHAVVEFAAPWGRAAGKWSPAWGEETRSEIEGRYADLVARLGPDKAHRIANFNRNLVIFPNLVLIDAAGLVIRMIQPTAPGFMEVCTWAITAGEDSEWVRDIRLKNFLTFLGPGGLATPDDVEALERCQQGYSNSREAAWNDISKGSLDAVEQPMEDEGHIRGFWRYWAECLDRVGVAPGSGGQAAA